MRRMYGDVRQLNLMRLEIDNSIDDEPQDEGRSLEEQTTTSTKDEQEDATVFFEETNDLNSSENMTLIKPKSSHQQQLLNNFQEIKPKIKTRTVNACPIKEEVVAPYWANNTRGEILALLNLYPFEQYVHWEKCNQEHKQMYCREGCR
jgi:hypothetical protein